MCQPHKLWRFPRGTNDLPAVLTGNRGSVMQNLREQLSEEEYERLQDHIWRHHFYSVQDNQCCSMVVQRIRAPVHVVWSVVRRFDNPQAYKHFIRSCSMRGDGKAGSTREVRVISGLPAATSTERLEILDDDEHVLSFKVVGGEHRLRNYQSFTTLHGLEVDDRPHTIVMESYVVDIPEGNDREETCLFVDTIVKYNLQSLAQISERLARRR